MIDLSQTIELDRCLACDGVDSLHEHHVIPRHCGGSNGPTVTVCSRCHGVLHDAAKKFALTHTTSQRIGIIRSLITDVSDSCIRNLLQLASVVFDAERAIQLSSNKSVMYSFRMKADMDRKVEQLKTTFGVTSKEEAILKSIQFAHQSLIRPKSPK